MKKILFLSLIFILLASCNGKNETINDNDIPDIPTDDSDTASVDDTDSTPVDDADSQPEPSDDDADTDPTDDADSQPEPSDDDADSEPTDDADSQPEPSDNDTDTEPTDDADSQPELSDDDADSEPTDDADSQPEPSDDDVDTEPTDDTDSQPEPSDDDTDSEPTDDADSQPEPSDDDVDTAPLNGETCAEVGGTWNEEEHKCTKTVECSGKPANSEWSSEHTSYTMEYADGEWTGTIVAKYIDESGSYCGFSCIENYFWNGLECLNPCVGNPCQGLENSTEECIPKSLNVYSCKCEDGYFWWNKQGCLDRPVPLGRICTGQSKCYHVEEISCPESEEDFYGQDAQYAAQGLCMEHSFTVKTFSNQNVVLDNNTGLMWQQKSPSEKYTWDDAKTYCSDLTYAGFDDWRLPKTHEILTIADSSKRAPGVDKKFFTNMPYSTYKSTYLWLNHEYAGSNLARMFIPDNSSIDVQGLKTSEYNVMCVRGNDIPTASFVTSTINDEVVATDLTTGLMWQKTFVTGYFWRAALEYCENLIFAGYSDWRLPNKNELASLINHDKLEDPRSDFPEMGKFEQFQSSTSLAGDAERMWFLGTGLGRIIFENKSGRNWVKCVRNAE